MLSKAAGNIVLLESPIQTYYEDEDCKMSFNLTDYKSSWSYLICEKKKKNPINDIHTS